MTTPIEQLQAIRSIRENWDGYGAAAPQADIIDFAQEFASLIEAMLRTSSINPSVLHMSPTRVGGILVEWEDPSAQHEVDIAPDRSISFLHLNKATGQIETRKLSPGSLTVIHPGLLQELRQLLAA
jgi:hypothetical protein